MNLIVVGSMAYDSVETPAGKVDRALGGSATFFSMASSLLAPTAVIAVVGEDFDEADLERLRARGIDVQGVSRVAGRTFRWGGRYSRYFETRESLFTELNVFADFKPVIPASQRATPIVFLANIHPTLQRDVLDQMDAPRFVALDTMNFWIGGALAELREVLKRVDLLFINDEEAFELSGVGMLAGAAAEILKMGPRWLVIKRGEHGAFLFGEGVARYVPAVLLERIVDPTGAGDTFAGGFLGWLAHKERFDQAALEEAMVAGTLVASHCCEGFSVDAVEALDVEAIRVRQRRLAAQIADLTLSW